MNYALRVSLMLEKHMAALRDGNASGASSTLASSSNDEATADMPLEDRALQLAVEEEYVSSGERHRPWAAHGRACRMGEIVLLVDSDTVVPSDCLRDAARELAACPTVGILQHASDVMQVVHHYFENGKAYFYYFTRRINKCISITCANGEIAPFVGHNAFLRWRALQGAAFIDPVDGQSKIWSENNVSENPRTSTWRPDCFEPMVDDLLLLFSLYLSVSGLWTGLDFHFPSRIRLTFLDAHTCIRHPNALLLFSYIFAYVRTNLC